MAVQLGVGNLTPMTSARRRRVRRSLARPSRAVAAVAGERIDDATRDYFVALTFDIAMADPDATDAVMLAGAKIASEIGASERMTGALRRDLKWTKARSDELVAQAAKAA